MPMSHERTELKITKRKETANANALLPIVMVFVLLLFFSEAIQKTFDVNYIGYYDELLIFMLLGIAVFQIVLGKKKTSKSLITPFILMTAGVITSLFYFYRGIDIIILQSIINFKLFILWFALFTIFKNKNVNANTLLSTLWWITIVGFTINLLTPESFYGFFKPEEDVRERYGIMRIEGFQLKPNDMAIFLSLFLFNLNKRLGQGNIKVKTYSFFLAATLISIVFSGSRVGLAGAILSFTAYVKTDNAIKLYASVAAGIAGLAIYISLFGDGLLLQTSADIKSFSTIDQTKYIRAIMIYYGVILGVDYFPIGVGAGNFGTVLSENSPVYAKLGISWMEFFDEFWGVFDSNLASLIGEYGFLFAIAIIGSLLKIVKNSPALLGFHATKLTKREYTSLALFILLIITTNPIIMHHYTALCLFILLTSISKNEKQSIQN